MQQTAALFAPSEIDLPDYDDEHWLSFRRSDEWARLYSEESHRFRRKFPEWDRVVQGALVPRRRTAVENRKKLEEVVARLSEVNAEAAQLAAHCDHPAAKVSILSFLILDAQVTFFQASEGD